MNNLSALVFAALLTAGVFVADLLTPSAFTVWMAYLLPLVIVSRIATPRKLYLFAVFCTFLIILDYLFSYPGIAPGIDVFNLCLGIAVGWIFVHLMVRYMQSEEKARGIDELKKAEQALEGALEDEKAARAEAKRLEREREDFLAMVTHDLKSPLTVINGYIELALMNKDRLTGQEILEMLEAMHKSGDRLMEMLDDLATLSGFEAGKIRLDAAPEDLPSILMDIKEDFSPVAMEKGVTLEAEISDVPVAPLDRKHIERAVANLVQNALKYTPPGGRVTLRAESGKRVVEGRRKARGFIAVSVQDSGPGIPPDDIDRIFEKYYRSRNTRGVKGSGLGLSIAKAVTEAHGGRIAVQSEPGRGSIFKMFFPLTA